MLVGFDSFYVDFWIKYVDNLKIVFKTGSFYTNSRKKLHKSQFLSKRVDK